MAEGRPVRSTLIVYDVSMMKMTMDKRSGSDSRGDSIVLGVDPSVKALGWAVIRVTQGTPGTGARAVLVASGCERVRVDASRRAGKGRGGNEWIGRMDHMIDAVDGVVREHGRTVRTPGGSYGRPVVDAVAVEWPIVFGASHSDGAGAGSGSSRGDAAANSGDLLKLAAVASGVRASLVARGRVLATRAMLVPVSVWKGQTPKSVTRARMMRRYGVGTVPADHNACDAVGVATWAVERWLRLVVA